MQDSPQSYARAKKADCIQAATISTATAATAELHCCIVFPDSGLQLPRVEEAVAELSATQLGMEAEILGGLLNKPTASPWQQTATSVEASSIQPDPATAASLDIRSRQLCCLPGWTSQVCSCMLVLL